MTSTSVTLAATSVPNQPPPNRKTRTTRYSGNSGPGNRTADHSPAPGVNNSRHQKENWSRLPLSQCHHQAEVSQRFRIELFFRDDQAHDTLRQNFRVFVSLYPEFRGNSAPSSLWASRNVTATMRMIPRLSALACSAAQSSRTRPRQLHDVA